MSTSNNHTLKDCHQLHERRDNDNDGELPSDALLSSTGDEIPGESKNEHDEQKTKDGEEEGDVCHGVPVDRGWAWVIMLAQFKITLMIVGYGRALSIFFLEFIDLFDVSVSMATVTFGVMSAFCGLGNVIVTYLVQPRVGTRKIVITGACLCALFTAVSSLATSMQFLMVTHSIIGFSYSLMYIPSVTLLSCYFNKRRSFAVAVANTGISISTLIFPPLTQFLITSFGTRGALLLVAGIKMQVVVAACLLRPVSSYTVRSKRRRSATVMESCNTKNGGLNNISGDSAEHKTLVSSEWPRNSEKQSESEIERMKLTADCLDDLKQSEALASISLQESSSDYPKIPVSASLPADNSYISDELSVEDLNRQNNLHTNTSTVPNITSKRSHPKDTKGSNVQRRHSLELVTENQACSARIGNVCLSSGMVDTSSAQQSAASSKKLPNGEPSKDGGPHPVPTGMAQSLSTSMLTLQSLPMEILSSSQAVSTDQDTVNRWGSCCQYLRKIFGVFDLSLFKNWLFRLIICYLPLGLSEGFIGFYFPSLGVGNGLARADAALLMTVVGGVDLVSRLAVGYLADLNLVRRTHLVAVCLIFLGIAAQLTRFYSGFGLLAMFAVIYGLCGGACHNLMVVVIIDLVGLPSLGKTMGLVLVINSICTSLNHPIVGALVDLTGSFATPFNYIGGCLLGSGLVLLLEPIARRLEAQRMRREPERDDDSA